MGKEPIHVTGLKEFQKSLRKMDKDLPKGLRLAQNEAATFLINRVQPTIPRKTGAAAASMKARSTQRSTRIAVGGKKAPYYPWLDFGGRTGPNKSVERPFYKEGRYLYPMFRKSRDEFQDILQKSLVAVAEGAGVEIH